MMITFNIITILIVLASCYYHYRIARTIQAGIKNGIKEINQAYEESFGQVVNSSSMGYLVSEPPLSEGGIGRKSAMFQEYYKIYGKEGGEPIQ